MKVKTSLSLSEDLIRLIDELYGSNQNRSEFIEKAVRDYIERKLQREKDRKDLSILNKKADKLNKEAVDVLLYQADL